MAYRSLSDFIQALERADELIRISEHVSPRLEISEIADRMVKNGGKALLFEDTGTEFPLLINAMASDRRICLALGVENLEDIGDFMTSLFTELTSPRHGWMDKLRLLPSLKDIASWFPSRKRQRGECQEVVMDPPDLGRLPVLTCWPFDGGPFITLPCVHTKDPNTGAKNLGMYRMQVFGPEMTGMHWHLHKGSANHYMKYREAGKIMPVTVTLGGDPAYSYAATAPLPENVDEYLLAGFLRKKKVELVKCLTNDLEVPSDVDFVIEGYVDPMEALVLEGPFGDHTGFYSLADHYPAFHVTCITHRRDAVYPATIVGIPPQEDGWIGKATERIFLSPIRMTVAPEITDMHMPVEGVFHNITLVGIRKRFPGHGAKIINSLWGAGQMMFNKILVVADHHANLSNYEEIGRLLTRNCDPLHDIHLMRGPLDVLDHASSNYAYGSKIGFDVTSVTPDERPPVTAEPKTGDGQSADDVFFIDMQSVSSLFPGIKSIRSDLPSRGISVLILGVEKSADQPLKSIMEEVFRAGLIKGVKFVVLVDHLVNINDTAQVVWLAANNLDPIRDTFYPQHADGFPLPVLCLDGTSKRRETDNFNRDWPNVIVMDDQTIQTIDQRWNSLNLGPIIPSPSLQYKNLVTRPGAVAKPGTL